MFDTFINVPTVDQISHADLEQGENFVYHKQMAPADIIDGVKYVVMETVYGEATYVEFMLQLWLADNKNSTLKERQMAEFNFPCRLPNQSKDGYFKFVKHAKFECLKPDGSAKWERRRGKILKMGLGLFYSENII